MAYIRIRNAYEHNLKNIDLDIPRNKLVVFTGISGSGKSSLVFDTIYSEAQRQFLESMTVYARKRMPKFSRPAVDEITGISPAIVIDQKRLGRHPRSTVGTVTEIYTYLRLLFSRCGRPRIGDSTLFSFNTPEGMCPTCRGLGEALVLNKDILLDWDKTLAEGAVKSNEYRVGGRRWNILKASGLFNMDKMLKDFCENELNKLLYAEHIVLTDKDRQTGFIQNYSFEGVVTGIMRRRVDKRGVLHSTSGRDTRFFDLKFCTDCQGSRLNRQALAVTVGGRNIADMTTMELTELRQFLAGIKGPVAEPIVAKINELLDNLIKIGVGYLSLSRAVGTLSGGESQRVKMARQLGLNLIELMYILDEPSIGLHAKDISHLTGILQKLKDKGNTVLVVEHDPAVIRIADWVVDIGPGAGRDGGKLVFNGQLQELLKSERSVTSRYLQQQKESFKSQRRQPTGSIRIADACANNLKNVSVDIPLGIFTCITGVAGSGKSTLVDIFIKENPGAVVIDQSPIGRMERSSPATYIGIFDLIRREYSQHTGRRISLFSFNSEGACPKCRGLGYRSVEMHFLDSVNIVCSLCRGQRYNRETLAIKYKGKNIAEALKMTADEAVHFFDDGRIIAQLRLLREVGLGYLGLGQPTTTLSGGEAQRIKLVKELRKKGNIYVLDEPTTGLHMADIERLMMILNRLVDQGNTVIVIEHNLDVIAQADWIIDLGPEGGKRGGRVVAEGTPEEVVKVKESYTGLYLRQYKTLN